ncbi:hypothetical protein Q5752_004473 [Cryptotrichosporon argae]
MTSLCVLIWQLEVPLLPAQQLAALPRPTSLADRVAGVSASELREAFIAPLNLSAIAEHLWLRPFFVASNAQHTDTLAAFVADSFDSSSHLGRLRGAVDAARHYNRTWDKLPRRVTTTSGTAELPDEFEQWGRRLPGWHIEVFQDDDMERMFERIVGPGGGRLREAWEAAQFPVLKADLFRYLYLLVAGGIYADSDTQPVSPPSLWGSNARSLTHSWLANALSPSNSSPDGRPLVHALAGQADAESAAARLAAFDPDAAFVWPRGIADDSVSAVLSVEWDAFAEGREDERDGVPPIRLEMCQWAFMDVSMRVGDLLLLPRAGFSWHHRWDEGELGARAGIAHGFRGSWKGVGWGGDEGAPHVVD